MRAKGFHSLLLLVILTAPTGCDNVQWGGMELQVQPPPPTATEGVDEERTDEEDAAPEPVQLGPLLYLVERTDGGEAGLLPVAAIQEEGYVPLPGPDEVDDLIERFPIQRWEEGTRFVLLHQGVRAGVFTADGTVREEPSYCLARARGRGTVELRPEASSASRFLALRMDDLDSVPSSLSPHPGVALDDELRTATGDAARNLIARREIPWPRSIPEIQRRADALVGRSGQRAGAATYVFGDELDLGVPDPRAYALFLVTREGEDGWRPVISWYQRQDSGGKAFPGFLAAHDVRRAGSSDLLLEVFGEEARWLAVLGWEDDGTELVYQDPCGEPPGPDAIQFHP